MAELRAPARSRIDISPTLNFMLQMLSISEQQETRRLQERQISVDEAALDISERRLPSQIGQAVGSAEQSTALAAEARARTDLFIKETNETFNAINTENRRQLAVLTQLGVEEDVLALKRKSVRDKAVQAIWDDQPDEIKFNIAHADQLGKLATAEIRGLTAQNAAANQTNQMLTLQHKIKLDALNQQMSGLATMESPNDRVKAAQALQSGNAEMFAMAMAGEAAFVEAERAKGSGEAQALKQTTPVTKAILNPNIDRTTEYTSNAMTHLRIAQDTGTSPPEFRKIRVKENVGFGTLGPFGWIGPKQFQVMTEQEARSKGFGAQWDAQNVAEPVSVKEGVKSAVKKTTGTKKAATSKQITDSRGWVKFVSPDGVDTWVNPKDVELAKSRGYTLGTK